MAGQRFADEQRLAFGRVAELYHAVRPSYPPAALDAIVAFGDLRPGARVIDVGAGTGKLTALLAGRGLSVLALEPSADMARVARMTCDGLAGVEIVEAPFEAWTPPAPAAAVLSAQAWHWIDPAVRYHCAHAALAPAGILASIWTFPDWTTCALRDALRDTYARAAPDLAPAFPMHPASEPERLAGDWPAEVTAAGLFTAPEVITHRWSQSYSGEDYARLVATHQDHILLGDAARRQLLDAVAETVDQSGGSLELPLATSVCIARRAG